MKLKVKKLLFICRRNIALGPMVSLEYQIAQLNMTLLGSCFVHTHGTKPDKLGGKLFYTLALAIHLCSCFQLIPHIILQSPFVDTN